MNPLKHRLRGEGQTHPKIRIVCACLRDEFCIAVPLMLAGAGASCAVAALLDLVGRLL